MLVTTEPDNKLNPQNMNRAFPYNELSVRFTTRTEFNRMLDKTWHAEGATRLSEDQATDLVMAALPDGGPRLVLDTERHAKSYLTNIGVMVAIWKPRPARR